MTKAKFDLILERLQRATGIANQNDLARSLGVNRSAISQARNKDAFPDKWILHLFRRYNINPDWLETGEGPTFVNRPCVEESEFIRVPKVKARLSAGGGSFESGSDIENYYSFRSEWLHGKGHADKMVLMNIFGNSMEPSLKDGDTVLIDTSMKDIIAGAVYAVGVEDTIMVKRVEKHPNKLVLISDNTDYAPIFLLNEEIRNVRIIGKALWICREFR